MEARGGASGGARLAREARWKEGTCCVARLTREARLVRAALCVTRLALKVLCPSSSPPNSDPKLVTMSKPVSSETFALRESNSTQKLSSIFSASSPSA